MPLSIIFALEWIKLRNLRALIFLIVFIIIATTLSFFLYGLGGLPPDNGVFLIPLKEMNPFGGFLRTFSGNLAIISSLFFILQTGAEYKFGLIRKNIIDGMGRHDVFNGRLVFLFGSYTLWTILLVIVFLAVGLYRMPDAFGELVGSIQWTQVIKYLIYVFFYGVVSLFLVTITRSSTISILILLGVLFIEPFVILGLRHYEMTDIIPYLPFELAATVRTDDIVSTTKLIVFLGYFLTFLGLSQYINLKRDL